ncbi:phytoene desaturase family protein [Thermocrinis sp.]|jgi:phytoene dehydrogenase-like protein|uniref:phytoene desaturase family protein n=1 Tax=Thermocrinis sp. TaxID=2024383 RepID=UPI003C1277D6
MFDYVIVGGGIGGVVSYAILKKIGRNVALLEKEPYLGGCSATFRRKNHLYNAGASTLVGLEDHMPLGKVFKFLNLPKPKVKKLEVPMVVYVGDKVIKRYSDREKAIYELEKNFNYKNLKSIWQKVYSISDANWQSIYSVIPINYKNPKLLLKKFFENCRYIIQTLPYHFKTSYEFFKDHLGNFDEDFKHFLDNQILMTSQGYSEDVPISVGAMGLTYPNLDNYYVYGGMGKVFDFLAHDYKNVFLRHRVIKIRKVKDVFQVITDKGVFEAKNVILNKTIWDYCDLLEDLKEDCIKNRKIYSKIWSSLTIYFNVEDKENLIDEYHYQIIHKDINPYTGSNSFFVSVSDKEDEVLTKDGKKSVTISTHCKISLWQDLDKQEYLAKKEKAKEFILNKLFEYVPKFKYLSIENVMVGTPKTFQRYTGRYNGTVGGIPLIKDYIPLRYPFNFTPIKGLYLVGDSVFPGQGWPGVIVGVLNLLLQIEDLDEILH